MLKSSVGSQEMNNNVSIKCDRWRNGSSVVPQDQSLICVKSQNPSVEKILSKWISRRKGWTNP